MTSPIDAELAKCLERAEKLHTLSQTHPLFAPFATLKDDVQKLIRAVEEMRETLIELARFGVEPKYVGNGHGEVATNSRLALDRVAEILGEK